MFTSAKFNPQGCTLQHHRGTSISIRCIEEWVQENHSPTLLRQIQRYYTTDRCKQERIWCSYPPRQQPSILCLMHTYISWKELPEPWKRMYGSYMAAVWGMEKFHYFLYGKHFILQTDQKPLVSIFQKHMIDVSPRIQQIAICAWQYQFQPQYISSKMNVIADALSRVTLLDFEDHDVDKEVLAVNVLTYTAIEEREKTELLDETDKDAELQALKMVISKGWPKKRRSLTPNLQPYWNYRDELTIEDGILMKGQKIIIPTSLKQQYIDKIHAGHTGIGSCLKKGREYIFWVNYSKDIQEAVEKCSLCQEQQNVLMTNQRYVSEVPPHPWHTLGSDLFYHKRLDFLVVVDYFSKFLIVRKIPNSTSSAIIKELDSIFSEYGNPYLFRSDNGPCYTSVEFKIFLDEWKIEHQTSSPHYPQ